MSTPGETYQFIVRAKNAIGTSTDSSAYSVIAATNPDPPTTFVRNEGQTSKTQVAFTWSAPIDNGGSSIIDYSIDMDANNDGNFSEVATGVTTLSHIETSLSEGTSYKFKIRARNAVDFSTYSSIFTIIAATVPSQPSAPTTALNGDQTQVVIDWSAPSDLGGLSISGYRVKIKTDTGSFEKDTANCNAESDTGIISATNCSVPVATLNDPPFNLGSSA